MEKPRQERSRRTTRRIIDATVELLSRKSFAEISVIEIAQKAGVSIGGFYARFPSKDALLEWFDEHLLEEELLRRKQRLAGGAVELEQVVRDYVADAARFFRQNRELLSRIALNLRSGTAPEWQARARRFNDQIHREFLAEVLAHKHRIGHPRPEAAVNFGIMVVSAALREQILYGDRKLNPRGVPDRLLVDELTRMFLDYLQVLPAGMEEKPSSRV